MKFLVGFFSFEWMRVFDFLAPLAIRLFMAPLLWVSGVKHLGLFSSPDFILWNPLTWINKEAFTQSVASMDTIAGLGLTPEMLVIIIGSIEIAGAILLILGFAVRWITLGLLFILVLEALLTVTSGHSTLVGALQQLVMTHGYTDITSNQLEVYVVYFIMFLALFFMGPGRWVSLDWFIYKNFQDKINAANAPVYHDPFEIDATDDPGIRPAAKK